MFRLEATTVRYTEGFITLADLYRAYRKAKADAFFEGMHFDALSYLNYEKSLDKNLKLLLGRLRTGSWISDPRFIGGFSYAPKSLAEGEGWNTTGMHFSTLNHHEDWENAFVRSKAVRATADFRLIMRPTVAYQIVSALWIMKVGHLYEAEVSSDCSFGNRLRRHRAPFGSGDINRDCIGLFSPYFGGYREWRTQGLKAMREELGKGHDILAVTMDVRRFYHNVAPHFLLRDSYLEKMEFVLVDDQVKFTADFIESIGRWYHATPDYLSRPAGALPVGLSASKVISNCLLYEFDGLMTNRINAAYYGRYVDDIFLVVRNDRKFPSGEDFMRWLSEQIPERLKFSREGQQYETRFIAPYCEDSEVVFSGAKQKIFSLNGRHGLDLVDQIEEQIRRQSSEHRMLPMLPRTDGEMLSQALLATPDATLEADALRKADVVSVKRLGFSLLLSDVESYAKDLVPKDWIKSRKLFYGLVTRHVVTPKGIFDYFAYINRVFGLMVACGDNNDALEFLESLAKTIDLVGRTSSAGTTEGEKFDFCKSLYAKGLLQAAIQSSTVKGFRTSNSFLRVLKAIRKISRDVVIPSTVDRLKVLSSEVLRADFGRRPYKEYWYLENKKESPIPTIPSSIAVRKVLQLAGIRRFRESIPRRMNAPYWPAFAFPTRPLTLPEITMVSPSLLDNQIALRSAIFSLRGARIRRGDGPRRERSVEAGGVSRIEVPLNDRDSVNVSVVNFLSTDKQWVQALSGAPDKSVGRYYRINKIINDSMSAGVRVDYVAFPESSVPRRWAYSIAGRLAKAGISFLAGMENGRKEGDYRNDALVSLVTSWPGYRTHVNYVQPKILPAYHEGRELKRAKRKLFKASSIDDCRPVYMHGNHAFGLLLCSDLTTIDNRRYFQGEVDSLFVLEWNRDVNSFSALVESAALDLHAYVVQINNRAYGDSRVRVPRINDYERDLVRVKGGAADYFVVAGLQVSDLRRFHAKPESRKKLGFKPLPIGFSMSERRRQGVRKKKKLVIK